MTRFARTALTTATALVALLAAAPARADHDHDRDDHHGRWRAPAPVAVAPAPVVVYPAPAPRVVVSVPWRPAHWRGGGWRVNELRHEYGELDAARDRFYATWNGNPWERDRFEGWYASRRAELDARWSELERR